jgi:hypothetical protein
MSHTQIYSTNDDFDFNIIKLSKPIAVSSGQFMLKFTVGEIPLYINPPKCALKLCQKGGKRTYCDFIFSQENDSFIWWIENLEKLSQEKIYENRAQWFESDLEKEDIENYFTSTLKIYKSGKNYILRTLLPSLQQQQKEKFKIYDENENEIQFDSITENMQIMCVLEVQGIRCSASSFQIDMLVKQMMVLQPVNIFDKCILKKTQQNEMQHNEMQQNETQQNETQHNETQHNETQQNETQHNETQQNETQQNETQQNDDLSLLENLKKEEKLDIPEKTMIIIKNEEEKSEKKINLEEMEESPTNIINEVKKIPSSQDELYEVDFDINDIDEKDAITIKQRKEMYVEMYVEARRKAKIARDLALSAYLEARRIKNTYMLEDILDESDESDIDELEQMECMKKKESKLYAHKFLSIVYIL